MNRIQSGPRVPVAVLGATGAVGQKFLRLLHGHPFFEVAEVAASERSAGRTLGEAITWREGTALDGRVAALEVMPCAPDRVRSPVVFSALDASVAGEVEQAFAADGRVVLSNARNHRLDRDVPLVIPEVNADHLALLERQRARRGWSGAIVTNANCSTTVLAMALAPLHAQFTVRDVFVATLQALSGAGYPGLPAMDAVANVIPFIGGEEEKIEAELPKLLGRFEDEGITEAETRVSAHTNRVPIVDGHTVCVTAEFARAVRPEEAVEALEAWRGDDVCRGLPSAPTPPVLVRREMDRPQVRLDVDEGGGMTVVVGRVRGDASGRIRLTALGHNTVRGAAGGSILNAEVMGRMGLLPGVPEGAW